MNCNELVANYINHCEKNEPIFIEDIQEYLKQYIENEDLKKVFNNLRIILKRLNENNTIKTAYRGIYYIPKSNMFGEIPLSNLKIIQYKYLNDTLGNVKGYITGSTLYNKLGLTTQVPNIIEIVTNECKNNNKYYNYNLNAMIRKPKIEINNENHLYLQVIDIIENNENVAIEVDNFDEIIYNFIKENNLSFEKLIMFANKVNSKKALEKLICIAR